MMKLKILKIRLKSKEGHEKEGEEGVVEVGKAEVVWIGVSKEKNINTKINYLKLVRGKKNPIKRLEERLFVKKTDKKNDHDLFSAFI